MRSVPASVHRGIAILLVLASVVGAAPAAEPETLLRVGFAERDITPELGMEQPGGYSKVFHQSLHDPCKVRAAVFDDGAQCAALVGVDALMIRQPLVDAVRRAVHEKTGMAPAAILIGASHSHSSGPTGMVLPGEYDQASELVKSLAYEQSSCANPQYLQRLETLLVEAICAAYEARSEARCGVGRGHEDRVAFNRRFRMANGLTATHPGVGNPEMREPAGPIDPEVGVLGVWNPAGKCLGCVVNYACHGTCNPGGISANWIYYLEQTIRGALGPECVVVFLQGACGDVTQVDNRARYVGPGAEEGSRLVGGRVGAEAVQVLLGMTRGALGPVAAGQKVLEIPRRRPRPERVQKALELAQQPMEKVGAGTWIFAKETVLADAKATLDPMAHVEVEAVQVGPAVFVANPSEFFVQLGLDIKAQSPFPFTFVVELANDCVGYVPTEEAFGPQGGGYETRLTSYSNLDITAGTRLVETSLELVRQMTPGVAPQPKPLQVREKTWSYGGLPPEID